MDTQHSIASISGNSTSLTYLDYLRCKPGSCQFYQNDVRLLGQCCNVEPIVSSAELTDGSGLDSLPASLTEARCRPDFSCFNMSSLHCSAVNDLWEQTSPFCVARQQIYPVVSFVPRPATIGRFNDRTCLPLQPVGKSPSQGIISQGSTVSHGTTLNIS